MAPRENASCLSGVLADLHLHQRKAFELCAAVFSALRACDVNPGETAIAEAVEKARKLANAELKTQNNNVLFETFQAEALGKVIREAEEVARDFPLSGRGLEAVCYLRRLQASSPNLTAANSSCLIKSTYVACYEAAKKFYSDHLTLPIEFPKISLRIGVANGLNKAFPGRVIAFNGSLRYEEEPDSSDPKHSVVSLKVWPVLDRGCLPALPFILMHEILCHWPQMARCPGARPRAAQVPDPHNKDAKKQEIDPISEGWMDNLTSEVLRGRCIYPDAACWEEGDTAEAIHNERIQINRVPTFQDADEIAHGHHAAELVRWLYLTEQDGIPSTAELDFRRLSCELNAADWNYQARRIGCANIIHACQAHFLEKKGKGTMSTRDRTICDGLLAFRRNGDFASVLVALHDSNGLEDACIPREPGKIILGHS
jgi:hypothetical protein